MQFFLVLKYWCKSPNRTCAQLVTLPHDVGLYEPWFDTSSETASLILLYICIEPQVSSLLVSPKV